MRTRNSSPLTSRFAHDEKAGQAPEGLTSPHPFRKRYWPDVTASWYETIIAKRRCVKA